MSRTDIPMEGIPEFFSGRSILITGGSGFLGKVLVEKLLRSCPDLEHIYFLIRPKRGVAINDRIKKITDNVLFDSLKASNKDNLKKIIPIIGDITEIDLGISAENMQEIIDKVSIVYHVAATIKFTEPLTKAVFMNVRGTKEVCKLALKLKQPPVLLHVSTAYCQHDKKVVEEIIYPPPGDWREVIELAESMDATTLSIVTSKYATGFPNTYTFSKALAEHVVIDLCGDKIPTIIYRPTIVMGMVDEPYRGWTDNFNGPAGIAFATAKGVLRSIYTRENTILDCIPVDHVIKGMIVSTWLQFNKNNISVYNSSNYGGQQISPKVINEIGFEVMARAPTAGLWYPSLYETSNKNIHMLNVFILQLLPALLLDTILTIFRKKNVFLKIQRKLYGSVSAMEYFMTNDWDFINDNFVNCVDYLSPKDLEIFGFDAYKVELREIFYNCSRAVKEIFFHEQEKDDNFYKIVYNVQWLLHLVSKYVIFAYLSIYLLNNVFIPITNWFYDYIDAL